MADPYDLFGNLGGSLIKDLLADRRRLRMAQFGKVEQELKQLDDGSSMEQQQSASTTAAGWVVNHQAA
jgi:hypothetical protein